MGRGLGLNYMGTNLILVLNELKSQQKSHALRGFFKTKKSYFSAFGFAAVLGLAATLGFAAALADAAFTLGAAFAFGAAFFANITGASPFKALIAAVKRLL